jgi:hypothetical protein
MQPHNPRKRGGRIKDKDTSPFEGGDGAGEEVAQEEVHRWLEMQSRMERREVRRDEETEAAEEVFKDHNVGGASELGLADVSLGDSWQETRTHHWIPLPRQVCRPMHLSFVRDSRSRLVLLPNLERRNHKHPSRSLTILPPERMRILTMAIMIAPFASTSWRKSQKPGLAGPVGLSSIYTVWKHGLLRKEPQLHDNKLRTVSYRLRGNGGAPDATYLRMFYRKISRVGVRKKSTRGLCQDCLLSRVVKLAQDLALFRRNAHTRAPRHVTPVLVRHALRWVPLSTAFAERNRWLGDVLIPTMRKAGVVARFAANWCLVESTTAPNHVTRGCVVLAKFAFPLAATADKSRRTSYVVTVMTSLRVANLTLQLMEPQPLSIGQDYSNAQTCAVDCSTAGSIAAKSPATNKMPTLLIALDLLTLYLAVRVVKHLSVTYLTRTA